MKSVILGFSMFCAAPALGQTAFPCSWQARADAIVEPWEAHTKTFANGAVRVSLLDVAEPAAAAYYLLILHPPLNEMGIRACTTVGMSADLGYAAMFFSEIEAGYDPAVGLTLQVPAIIYVPEQDFQNSTVLNIAVNQSTGDVSVSQSLGRE